MKFNKWTVGLATVGVISLASAARADEQMSMVQTALSQTTLSGYVDTAAQWNPGTDQKPDTFTGTTTPNIPHYAFAKNDGFSLNAVDIALDKPEDSSQWAAGYHVEVMAGSDSVGVGVSGALSLRQAFVRLHTPLAGNGIDWEIGVFDSIIGYESNSDPLNPNYTRSYGYTIEPTTMTGILGTYKICDEVSISGGIADNDGGLGTIPPTFGSPGTTTVYESQKTYLGSVTFTAPDSMGFLKGATASAGVIHGSDSYTYGNGTENNFYAGVTMPTPMSQLKLGAAFDYLWEPNFTSTSANENDNIWTVGVYGTYQATDKMSLNLRGEVGYDSSNAGDIVSLYPTGGAFEEITATVQYNLWANVMTRGEFRWDHVTHGDWFGAGSQTQVPGEGAINNGGADRNSDFLLALNIIYQF
jgi:Putative beta-barrel porin-2, OmpL-like. bbp2